MPTFLTNPRMNAALAERVRASVRQGRSRGRVGRRWTAAFRFVAVSGIVLSLIALSALQRRDDAELERARQPLLETVSRARAQLSNDDMQTLARAVAVLLRAPGPYEGDRIGNEVRGTGGLAATLERPMIYVRAPLAAFAGEDALRQAANLSFPDAFVRCLVAPPRNRTEKALLEAIRGGAEHPFPVAKVHRLHDLFAGIPLLGSSFKTSLKEAKRLPDLSRFEHDLHAGKLDETTAAARARLLLFVSDEPSGTGGTTELDGERPHDVRVTLFDLEQKSALLRVRRHVDPSAFSDRARAWHAAALDACALSFDVREAVTKNDALTEVVPAR